MGFLVRKCSLTQTFQVGMSGTPLKAPGEVLALYQGVPVSMDSLVSFLPVAEPGASRQDVDLDRAQVSRRVEKREET